MFDKHTICCPPQSAGARRANPMETTRRRRALKDPPAAPPPPSAARPAARRLAPSRGGLPARGGAGALAEGRRRRAVRLCPGSSLTELPLPLPLVGGAEVPPPSQGVPTTPPLPLGGSWPSHVRGLLFWVLAGIGESGEQPPAPLLCVVSFF